MVERCQNIECIIIPRDLSAVATIIRMQILVSRGPPAEKLFRAVCKKYTYSLLFSDVIRAAMNGDHRRHRYFKHTSLWLRWNYVEI